MCRPVFVSLIGGYFFLAGIYLCSIAAIVWVSPDFIATLRQLPYAYGFTLASPLWSLIPGVIWIVTALGLFQLRNWARWLTMLMLGIGCAWAVPTMLMAHAPFGWRAVFNWIEIAIRAAAAFYLAQSDSAVSVFATRQEADSHPD